MCRDGTKLEQDCWGWLEEFCPSQTPERKHTAALWSQVNMHTIVLFLDAYTFFFYLISLYICLFECLSLSFRLLEDERSSSRALLQELDSLREEKEVMRGEMEHLRGRVECLREQIRDQQHQINRYRHLKSPDADLFNSLCDVMSMNHICVYVCTDSV